MTLSHHKIPNLVFFLIFWSAGLIAQNNTCTFSLPIQYTFKYTKEDPFFSEASNDMIWTIAEDEVKNPKKVSFTFNTIIYTRITTEGLASLIKIIPGNYFLSGSTQFRKFSMSAVMIPNRVNFDCRVEKKDTSAFFELQGVSNLDWQKKDNLFLHSPIPHYSCDSDTLIVQHIHFSFDDDALNRFKERAALINDYYAANSILDTLENKVKEMDMGLITQFPEAFLILEELNKALILIKERNFLERLNLDHFDPEGFQIKYSRLTNFSHSATMTFRENLKTPGVVNYTASPDSIIQSYLDGICRYIRWSMLVTERNSGIYNEFLERCFRVNAFVDESEVIRNLVSKIFPNQPIDSAMAAISNKIFKAYHERANRLMEDQLYPEAIELLANARKFSEINPWLTSSVNNTADFTRASNGIYNAYLGVADGAIRYGKNDMARSYMVRAQNYRKSHAAFVTADSVFIRVFKELVSSDLSHCDSLFNGKQYPEALQCYLDFEKGFDSLTLSLIHRDLKPKIQFCKYEMIIKEGLNNLSKLDKPEAGRNFFLAREFSEKEKFPPDTLLDSLCVATYPFYLVQLLKSSEVFIWSNRLEMARRFSDSIAFLQRTTGVQNSRELSDALAGYRRRIEQRTCWNANEAVEVFLLRAQRDRELKNFKIAALLTDSAILLVDQNPDCLISMLGVKDTMSKYKNAVDFQCMQQKIDLLVSTGQYEKCVSDYQAMMEFFFSKGIRRFGLDSIPMMDLIRDKSFPELTIQALLYYQRKNDFQETFAYIKLLRLQGYPKKNAKRYLEWAGREFAHYDFHQEALWNAVAKVRIYTGQDQWMKGFRVAYYSEARHLKHKPFFFYIPRKLFP
jgi:hypothetical protein